MESTSPEPRPKKRRLRYPRASNACNFCRKRKVRCSGTLPCEVCVREEVPCEYTAGAQPRTVPDIDEGTHRVGATGSAYGSHLAQSSRNVDQSNDSSRAGSSYDEPAIASRRNSMDPPQTFMHGNHIGATSGVSFLYGQWGKTTNTEAKTSGGDDAADANISHAPLMSWGDLPQTDPSSRASVSHAKFTSDQISNILDRYFQYISPTYRFLVQPTAKQWASSLVDHSLNVEVRPAQKACILLVCAQTLLHSPVTSGQDLVGRGDPEMSLACFEMARSCLDNEPGPPSLASVQARIGMCLYLLSTYRLNECRYCFSFAVSVATALGIHRKQSSSSKINTLEAEARKRAFWSAYILDGYLSVMLGRPRLLRDEDIDQPFPNNIADDDLISPEPIEDLPRHGNLEAFIAHAKLAKLMARGNDQLYPLHPLTNDQLLQRSNEMIEALSEWQNDLPKFLQARQKTFTGQRTFERQNTILKLAWAHVRILATRRCLLLDFSHADANPVSGAQDARAKRSIQECIAAIIMVLETVEVLIENGQCYGSFWSTQYVALVAISTLYVLIIQGVRHALPGNVENFLNVEECIGKARQCHEHLANLPPPGSQAERYHVLLSHLRSKAQRSLARRTAPGSEAKTLQQRSSKQITSNGHIRNNNERQRSTSTAHMNNDTIIKSPQAGDTTAFSSTLAPSFDDSARLIIQDGANDMSAFGLMLTPNSSSDNGLQYMLDFGWESLDNIGAPMRDSEGFYGFQGV